MVKIKYDVSNVEAGGGESPQPGMYAGKITSVTHRDKNKSGDPVNDLEIVVNVGAGLTPLWTYVPASDDAPNAWKLRELLDAVGLPPKGTFDTKAIEGKAVNVKVMADKDLDGNYRGKIKNLLQPGGDGTGASAEGDEEDYDSWEDDDLKAELAERDLKVSGRFSRQKAIDLLVENDGGGEEEDGGEDEAAAADEYDEWDDDDLKAEIEERGIEIKGRKSRDKMIEALREFDGPGASDESDDEPEDDYEEWTLDELKAEIKDRALDVNGRVTKDKAVSALRADDKAEAF